MRFKGDAASSEGLAIRREEASWASRSGEGHTGRWPSVVGCEDMVDETQDRMAREGFLGEFEQMLLMLNSGVREKLPPAPSLQAIPPPRTAPCHSRTASATPLPYRFRPRARPIALWSRPRLPANMRATSNRPLKVPAIQRTWIWQPYERTDGPVTSREPLRSEISERSDEELAQWFKRKLVAWPEPSQQRQSPQ